MPSNDETESSTSPDRRMLGAVAVLGAVLFFGIGYAFGHDVGEDDIPRHPGPGLEGMPGHHDMPGYHDFPGGIPDRPAGSGFLGIVGRDGPAAVRVGEVVPDGPADDAGVNPGDRIIAYAGREIVSMEQLADLVAATEPGTEVELVLGGPAGGRIVTVTIGERP